MINFWENVDLNARLYRFQGDDFRIVGKWGDHSVTLKKPDDKDRDIEEVKKVFNDISMYLSNEKELGGSVKYILLKYKDRIQLKIQEALEKGHLQEKEVPLELLPEWLAKVAKESKDMSEIDKKFENKPYLLLDWYVQSYDEYKMIRRSMPSDELSEKRLDDLDKQRTEFFQRVTAKLSLAKTEKILFKKLPGFDQSSKFLALLQKIEDNEAISDDELEKFIDEQKRSADLILATFFKASQNDSIDPALKDKLHAVYLKLCTYATLFYFETYVSQEKNDIDAFKEKKDSADLQGVVDCFNRRIQSYKTIGELSELCNDIIDFKEVVAQEGFNFVFGKNLSSISKIETDVSSLLKKEMSQEGIEEFIKKNPVSDMTLVQNKDEKQLHDILDTRISLIEKLQKKYIDKQPDGKAKELSKQKVAELVHDCRTVQSTCQGKFQKNFDFYLLQTDYKLRLSVHDVSISPSDEQVIRDAFIEAGKLPAPLINEVEHEGFLQKIDLEADDKVYFRADLHGDLETLLNRLELLKKKGMLDENYCCKKGVHLVFLGDYGDRGDYGLHVLHLLARLSIQNPNNVHLIRGNHESKEMLNMLGDERLKEFAKKDENWEALNSFIKTMPLSLHLRKKDPKSGTGQYARFVHGGVDITDDPKVMLDSKETQATMVVKKKKELGRVFNIDVAQVVVPRERSRANELKKDRNELVAACKDDALVNEVKELRENIRKIEATGKDLESAELEQLVKDYDALEELNVRLKNQEEINVKKLKEIHEKIEAFEHEGDDEAIHQAVAAEKIQHLWAWIFVERLYHPDMLEASSYLWSDIGRELKFGERKNAVITITPEYLSAYQKLTSQDELLFSGHRHFYQTYKALPVWSKNKSDMAPKLCAMTLPVSREIQIQGEKGTWMQPEHIDYDYILDLNPDIASSTLEEIKTDKHGTIIADPKAVSAY